MKKGYFDLFHLLCNENGNKISRKFKIESFEEEQYKMDINTTLLSITYCFNYNTVNSIDFKEIKEDEWNNVFLPKLKLKTE